MKVLVLFKNDSFDVFDDVCFISSTSKFLTIYSLNGNVVSLSHSDLVRFSVR